MVPIMIVISVDITIVSTTFGSSSLILRSSISFVYVGLLVHYEVVFG